MLCTNTYRSGELTQCCLKTWSCVPKTSYFLLLNIASLKTSADTHCLSVTASRNRSSTVAMSLAITASSTHLLHTSRNCSDFVLLGNCTVWHQIYEGQNFHWLAFYKVSPRILDYIIWIGKSRSLLCRNPCHTRNRQNEPCPLPAVPLTVMWRTKLCSCSNGCYNYTTLQEDIIHIWHVLI